MKQQLTVVFGGAFDPVHFGHIKPLLELSKCLPASRILFLPCYRQADKLPLASSIHRLAMLRLVIRPPQLLVDTRELDKQSICYTVDALTEFREELGARHPICFMLGQDAFAQIQAWERYERIIDLAHLIVTVRPESDVVKSHPLLECRGGWSPLAALYDAPAGKLCRFRNQPIAVSSGQVRECLMYGEQPKYLLPGAVWNYIRRHKLYSTTH